MSSNFICVGGFFLVDRCISVASFLSNCTRTEAENTIKDTDVSLTARGSITLGVDGRTGVVVRCGMELPGRDPNKDEKKPPNSLAVFLVGRVTRRFSVPDVCTHFIT
jgi:hypothetical protein